MLNIDDIVERLKTLRPVSIALTGSYAKNEQGPDSDIEIAVVFEDKKYKKRSELKKYSGEQAKVYPFKRSDLLSLKAPTPFPQKFYLWWIKNNSKTLWGKKIFEELDIKMDENDWKEVLFFEKGVVLSAMLSFRNGDKKTAGWGFSKSCLLATIAGLAITKGVTVTSYNDSVLMGSKSFPEFSSLIKKAERVRKGQSKIVEEDIYWNFKYFLYLFTRIN